MIRLKSTGDEATLALGTSLAAVLQAGDVVALYGDLGAGKTVLSRGMARGLGITEAVTSPTFTVAQEYPVPNGRTIAWFYHLDMYRIDNEASALAFGIEEYLFAAHAITFVEWPERIEALLRGGQCHRVTLRHSGEMERVLEFPDALGNALVTRGLPDGVALL